MSDVRAEIISSSPDGRSVIAVLATATVPYRDDFAGLEMRALCVIDLGTKRVRTITEPLEDAHAPSWSPDSTRVAFVTRNAEVVIVDLRTGVRTVAARVSGESRNPAGAGAQIVWSADGRTIAYTAQPAKSFGERFIARAFIAPGTLDGPIVVDGHTKDAPLLRAQGFEGAFFEDPPRHVYAGDRRIGTIGADEQLVAVVDDQPIVRERLAPVEGTIVHARRTGPDAWLLVSRAGATSIAWSLRAGKVRELGRTTAARVVDLTDRAFIVIEERGFFDRLVTIDFRSQATRVLLESMVVHRAVAAGENVLAVASSPTEPESIHLFTAREHARLGHWPGVDGSAFGGFSARVLRWRSGEAEIEGLYLAPASAKPRATLLFLHGGPEGRAAADANTLHHPMGGYAAILARRGFAVLLPNFRNGKELGNGRLFSTPAADALAGIRKLVDDQLAEPQRLGVYGFSYGAMLTSWIVARDHRFRAAAISAGTLDMLADDRARLRGDRAFHALSPARAGAEDQLLDQWLAPEKYREMSPLEGARDVRTPTLLISTAAEQLAGFGYPAYFNALRVNQVRVQWAYYPAAWHGGSWSVEDRVDNVERLIAWFE